MTDTSLWVADTETTGLDPHAGDRIIQIAAVEIADRKITGREFSTFVDPAARRISYEAWKIHGIDNETLAKMNPPTFAEAVARFQTHVQDAPLIMHNAPFDENFLKSNCETDGIPMITNPIIDSINLAKSLWPGKPISLDAIASRLDINNERKARHDALADCRLLARAWLAMLDLRDAETFSTSLLDQTNNPINESPHENSSTAWPTTLLSFDN